LSRSSSKVTGIYASYQASAFNDRLNTLISFRKEKNEDGLSGTVPSFGVNYEVIPGLTVFGSRSENFRINGPNITGAGVLPGELLPSSPPETAVGTDIGIKTSWRENSLVGTVTYFTLENSNIRRTDTQRTQYDEPRNLDNISSNNVQWFSFGGVERSEGMEIDLAWAPVRGYESVLGASYIWEAKIVSDPSRAVGTYDYEFQIGRRLGNTPKFQFKWWNKYKFSDGPLKGISVGAGLRHYGSTPGATHQPLFDEHNEAYTLIDLYVGHEAELWGHPIKTALTIENATNHKYIQGLNNTWADPRKIFLNISTKF
jgi:outer membrane receptor protein involved in Fe transport